MELSQSIAVVAIWAAVGYSAPHLGFFTIFLAGFAFAATCAVAR